MQFFQSFSSLGYSAINVVLIFLVIFAVVFRSLSFHLKPKKTQIIAALVLLTVVCIPFVLTVNFLASENKRLNEAVKQDGGLKRNFPKN